MKKPKFRPCRGYVSMSGRAYWTEHGLLCGRFPSGFHPDGFHKQLGPSVDAQVVRRGVAATKEQLKSNVVMLFLPNPKRRNSPAKQQENAIDLIVRSWKAKVESIRGNRIVFRFPVETRAAFVASGFWPMCHDA